MEVSPDEQTRRLKDRIDDGRKVWELFPMDLKSYDRWDDMFAATDTPWAPWYVALSDDKKKLRLNVLTGRLKRLELYARRAEHAAGHS